jgi:hypothetical protein
MGLFQNNQEDLNIPIILKTGLGGLGAAAGLPAGAVEAEESAIVNLNRKTIALSRKVWEARRLANFGESRSIPKKVGPKMIRRHVNSRETKR